jgi:alpha-tubulin suppressor-like RCC1 family protein
VTAPPADNRVLGRFGGWANVVDVAAGFGFTVARRVDVSVWGWGDNTDGRLGDTTPGNSSEASPWRSH